MPKRTPSKPARLGLAAALLLAAVPALAQPDAPAPPIAPPAEVEDEVQDGAQDEEAVDAPTFTREQRLAQLADPDHAVRADATAALLQDDTIDEPALAAMLAQADHPEQRRRLIHIAEHHLMRVRLNEVADELRGDGPPDQASVGFAYEPLLPEHNPHGRDAAIVILDTMPGFPGHAYLRPGDVILAINGLSSRSATVDAIRRWVPGAIGRHREGDPIALTVHREGEAVEITLNAAGIRTLNEAYDTTGAGTTVRSVAFEEYIEQALARLTDGLPPLAETLAPAE